MSKERKSGKKRRRSSSSDHDRKRRRHRDHSKERKNKKKHHSKDRRRSKHDKDDRDHYERPKHKEKSKKSEVKHSPKDEAPKQSSIDKMLDEAKKKLILEQEQRQLLEAAEEERKKRRERILAWQEKIKAENPEIDVENVGKEWNLEDEQDDQEVAEEPKPAVEPEDDDGVDPLDAYMSELKDSMVHEKSKDIKTIVNEEEDEKAQFVETIVHVKKAPKPKDDEILEQFGAAAEYSDEEVIEDTDDFSFQKKTIKNLPPVDHQKVFYREFRKDFYIEVPEIAKMTEKEVAAYRTELDEIHVKGKKIPKPIKKWVHLGLNPTILQILKKLKYDKPTPIQAQAIPAIMSGRDVIGIAKTGSGKTLAFLLPLLRHVLDQPPLEPGDGPIAMILSPTRELAIQTAKECRKFTKYLSLKCLCVFGGSVVSEQISELKRGAEIVVCTPGRLIDMLSVNCGKITNMRRMTYVILDEADRMLDMGFEPQVYKILQQIRPNKQLCLFTATFPSNIEVLARKFLDKPIEIIVGSRHKVNVEIKQHLLLLSEDDKFLKLLEILGLYADSGPILIFVEKQASADELLRDLLVKGHPCMTIHGGRDQYDRDSTLNDFKNGNISTLIATSVCARGIDVKNIVLVINYDCPNHAEDYIHRCGRTGRAGNKGTAITFVTTNDARYIKDIINVIDPQSCEIPPNIVNLHQRYMAIDHHKRSKNSGYSGHGYKFDDRELDLVCDNRKMLKWSFGWQDSGDEAEAEDKVLRKIENAVEKAFSSRPKTTTKEESLMVNQEKISKVQSIAEKLNERLKSSGLTSSSSVYNQVVKPVIKPKAAEPGPAPGLDIAKNIAAKMNVKITEDIVAKPKQETVKKVAGKEIYYEEIDINDFPQLARQKITSRETLDAAAEYSDCVITVKGSYCPTGKSVDIGDRRLHLLIEADTEFKIQLAKSEIKRVVKEESVKSDYVFTQPSGRYKIT